MHILDQVQYIYIQSCQPVHHYIIFGNDFIIIQVLGSDRFICRSHLFSGLHIHTAIDGIHQAFCQVCSCSEELHLFTCLCCRYTAADRVIIAPYRLHHIVILILHRAGTDGNVCCELLEILRQLGGIQNGQVRLRARSHIYQSMQETEIVLGYHGTSVYADSANFQRCPYRVTGEQLIVGRDSCEFYHTKLHYEMIDQLLCLFLSDGSIFQISLNINIKESGYTANTHSCSVLGLYSCQISKIQPLNCFFCSFCRFGNIVSIDFSHLLHLSKCLILSADLFSLTDHIIGHGSISAVCKVFRLLLHQKINSVQSHTAIITYNTASSISIRKSGDNLVVTCFLHLRCVGIEYTLVMSSAVFRKDLMKLRARFIAIGLASLLSHLDSSIWHECTLQRLICLQTNNLLQLLRILTKISCTM